MRRPFSSAKDPVNMAGYVIEKSLNRKSEGISIGMMWRGLPRDGSVHFARCAYGRLNMKNGHMEGFVNLPLDDFENAFG